MTIQLITLLAYIAYLVIMSIVAVALYFKDKKIAVKNNGSTGEGRIKEKTLLSVAVFGGSLGAQIGRVCARHKTDKKYFSLTIYLSIFLQYLTLVALIALAVL